MFFKKGRAAIDIETYTDNGIDRGSSFNMIPFCVTLVGDLQQLQTSYYYNEKDKMTKRRQTVVLVKDIKKCFTAISPKECLRKLIQFLMDNNFCYSQEDYRDLNVNGAGKYNQGRVHNYIFAHNGFGFDFRFMYEDLHSYMREFKIIGDINQTKQLSGNGLFFYDFSLIYREKLSSLAKTFFPQNERLWKLDSSVIMNIDKVMIDRW